ncbi:hypothetical protein SEVIR_9G273500v4 [Setaria viridis]
MKNDKLITTSCVAGCTFQSGCLSFSWQLYSLPDRIITFANRASRFLGTYLTSLTHIVEDVWYMKLSDDQHPYNSSEDGITRKTKNGYWKFMDSSRIPTSTAIIGVKITLEFYEGHALCGTKTGWVMHEYQVEHNEEANLPQDYKSLCKVFLKGEKNISDEIQQNSDNADSPKDSFKAYLQYLAKIEEPKQPVDADKQEISSSKGQNEQNTQHIADGIDIDNVLANEDYIELNDLLYDDDAVRNDALTPEDLDDLLIPQASAPTSTNSSKQSSAVHDALEDLDDLLTPEASASTSANSSKRSMFSEECFDCDAFLREILKDSNSNEGENKDNKFSIAAPTNLVNVVISPSEQGLAKIHDDNAIVAGTSQHEPFPGGDRDEHSSSGFKQRSPSKSSCFPSRSDSSQSNIKCRREQSSSKFGKIMKKYSCFRSL